MATSAAKFATREDVKAMEAERAWEERNVPVSLYGLLSETTAKFPNRPAITFQITSGPNDKAETLNWSEFKGQVTQAANLFRSLGVGENDVVAYLMPNANESVVSFVGGAVAGIVNPINPLLEPEQIGAILRETGASVLITMKAFPRSDVAQKAAAAVKLAPGVKTILEVDLNHYLSPPKSWIVPLIRPKNPVTHDARVMDFNKAIAQQNAVSLDFADATEDRVAAYFHTGGTTGMPKVAQHKYSGMMYNGWLGDRLLFTEEDTMIVPLPMFHVFAAYPVILSALTSGTHVVFPTPQGYRGEGVFDNFWKLIERWQVTFVITVPTAISALMQRPVDADVSSLKTAFSGSAPLPVELFNRFEKATGVNIIEGYGLTEATCLVSCNPPNGEKKIGSVGIPFPYTNVRILNCDEDGSITKECAVDEVGEICIGNPGVFAGSTYTEVAKNVGLFADVDYLRTGDLGRIDEDGYLWITGRAKDLIIRGGHNIDPAEIEEALAGHEAIAFAGAIGQPDSFAGELPCVYVELVANAAVTEAELMAYAKKNIHERAAHPKFLEIMPELPKTGVGKIFKPDLRKMAITRVFNAALTTSGFNAEVSSVIDDKKRGLVALINKTGDVDEEALGHCLGEFATKWDWAKDAE
ncbi:MAG: acyl-CoA synthetase [Pseudoruegeria sp.]